MPSVCGHIDKQLLLIIVHGSYMRCAHLKRKLKYMEKDGVVLSQLLDQG